jgi:transposase InsO family protein
MNKLNAEATVTIGELARIRGTSSEATRRWVVASNLPRKRRGRDLHIPVKNLPVEERIKVIQDRGSLYDKALLLPKNDINLTQAKALCQAWDSATGWNRQKAEARGELVNAFERFVRGFDLSIEECKETFIGQYSAGNMNLGVSEKTFEIIPNVSRSSLDLWRRQHRELGLAGLLESEVRGKPRCRITADIEAFILGIIAKTPHTRAVRVYEYIVNKFSKPGVTLPSEATVRRFIKRWKKKNAGVYTYLKNPDKFRSEYQAAFGDLGAKACHFLHFVELDNTIADVQCVDGKRYTLVVAIDIFSRKVKVLVVPTGKSLAIAAMLRWILDNWGVPDFIIVDNGQDFVSKNIEVVCTALNIERIILPPFCPEKKGFVERFIETLSYGLFEELAGYVGHNIAQRKDIEARRSFAQRMLKNGEVIEFRMAMDELQRTIDIWVEKIYHQRIHRGIGKTPEVRSAESPVPVRKIMDERVLDVLLAPAGKAVVGKKGIQFKNGIYVGVELVDYIRQRVQLRQDLADAGKIYVFELTGKFICVAKDSALEGLSVEEVVTAQNRQRKSCREQAKALKKLAKSVENPMLELLENKSRASGQVLAFHRTEVFETEAVSEASKAFINDGSLSTFQPEEHELPVKIVPFRGNSFIPVFEADFDKYIWLLKEQRSRELTDREKGFIEGFEASDDYFRWQSLYISQEQI